MPRSGKAEAIPWLLLFPRLFRVTCKRPCFSFRLWGGAFEGGHPSLSFILFNFDLDIGTPPLEL
jgi:hypothetical protein